MKRILLLTLSLILIFSLTACGTTTTEESTTENTTAAESTGEADAVTSASVTDDVNVLVNALKADGTWIAAALNDMVYDGEILVDGEFTNKDKVDRKLALYTQDKDRVITAQYTLTAPKMIVKSPNFRIGGGIFIGDIYVQAEGFKLDKASTVIGNIVFETQAYMDSYTQDETATLQGEMSVE